MKNVCLCVLVVAFATLLTGCTVPTVAIFPVGPEPIRQDVSAPQGYLQVFSATEPRSVADAVFYPHTGYSIYDLSGKFIKRVRNHLGDTDEVPAFVTVPAGNYEILAKASGYGRIMIPVIIEPEKTTIVHLDREWKPTLKDPQGEVVRLPNGEAIGWSWAKTASVP